MSIDKIVSTTAIAIIAIVVLSSINLFYERNLQHNIIERECSKTGFFVLRDYTRYPVYDCSKKN